MNVDLNRAISLVHDRTGLVPEVESAEELAGVLLEWGEEIAAENEQMRQRIGELERAEPATH